MYHALPYIREKDLYGDFFSYFPLSYYTFIQVIHQFSLNAPLMSFFLSMWVCAHAEFQLGWYWWKNGRSAHDVSDMKNDLIGYPWLNLSGYWYLYYVPLPVLSFLLGVTINLIVAHAIPSFSFNPKKCHETHSTWLSQDWGHCLWLPFACSSILMISYEGA